MSRFDALNENEEIMYEGADKFEPYPNEKIRMKLHTGEKREQLKESIQRSGILTPVIAMPSSSRGMLTIIAGANRVDIGRELGIQIPYQLKINITQEQADLICIDTNLLNRQQSDMLYSELSWLLRTKWEITREQGKRNDLDFTHNVHDVESVENEFKMSKRNIQYYIRLTYLIDDLMKLVDDKKLNFRSAVEISYLKEVEQQQLYEYITDNNTNIKIDTAEQLKKLSQATEDDIDVQAVLDGLIKPKSSKKIFISKKTYKQIEELIPIEDRVDIDRIIIESLMMFYGKAT